MYINDLMENYYYSSDQGYIIFYFNVGESFLYCDMSCNFGGFYKIIGKKSISQNIECEFYYDFSSSYFLKNLTYSTPSNSPIVISHYSNNRLISIFNPADQTTTYIIDEINNTDLESRRKQFNEYINQQIPTTYNEKLNIIFNDNGTIKKIINKPNIQEDFKNLMSCIIYNRINISNEVNIGLSNNVITPFIMANAVNYLYPNDQENVTDYNTLNIRLLNTVNLDNKNFVATSENTYFTRLSETKDSEEVPLSQEQMFKKLKGDFELNDCKKDFAIIPFECSGHISTILVDLRKEEPQFNEIPNRLYLFDTALQHANSCFSEENLKKYFNNLIKENHVFYNKAKIQAIGNCSYLTIAFISECSKLDSFNQVLQYISNCRLLVYTINKTSELMQESIQKKPLISFNEDPESITLNEYIFYTFSCNIKGLSENMRSAENTSNKNHVIINNDNKLLNSQAYQDISSNTEGTPSVTGKGELPPEEGESGSRVASSRDTIDYYNGEQPLWVQDNSSITETEMLIKKQLMKLKELHEKTDPEGKSVLEENFGSKNAVENKGGITTKTNLLQLPMQNPHSQ